MRVGRRDKGRKVRNRSSGEIVIHSRKILRASVSRHLRILSFRQLWKPQTKKDFLPSKKAITIVIVIRTKVGHSDGLVLTDFVSDMYKWDHIACLNQENGLRYCEAAESTFGEANERRLLVGKSNCVAGFRLTGRISYDRTL